ncbi:DMT family transporter [Desulfotalea psychrophila]|nr:DMT family transporter [Desulfotalea psychrophila]
MGRVLGTKKLLGWLAVFCSTFFFYFATVVIRLAEGEVDIDVSYFAFFRFILGFIVVSIIMLISRQPVRPRRYHFLLGRMLANTAAVYCFYKAASLGSVAEANILNMTYPLFVACASWFLFKSQRDWVVAALVALAFVGVWLVLNPGGDFSVNGQSIWGLASGMLAAAAIIYLNLCRIDHDSNTILFVLFGLGSIVMYTFFHNYIFWPNGKEFYYLMLCGAPGVIGQYLITFGFRFVTAVEGSVISSSRIMLAALLGPIIIGEPSLALLGWCGGFCIFVANVGLAMRKK